MDDNLPAGWYCSEDGDRRYWTGSEWLTPATNTDSPSTPDEGVSRSRESSNPSRPPLPTAAPGIPTSPDAALPSPQATRGRKRKRRMIGAIVSLAILLVAVGGALNFRHHQQETARKEAVAAAERQRAEEEKKVLEEAEKARQEAKRRLDNQKAIENAQRKQQEEREAEIAAIEESLNDYVAGWEPIERGSLYFRYLEDSEYRCGSFPCFGVSVFSVDGCPDGVFMEVSLLSHDTVVDYTNGRIGHLDSWEEGIHIFDLVTNYHFDTYRIDNIRCYK